MNLTDDHGGIFPLYNKDELDDNEVFSVDELSANASGGTELMKANLLKYVDNDLLQNFKITCSRVRELSPVKHNLLWLHDMAQDPESRHLADIESRNRFAKLVFVSYCQQLTYNYALGVPYSAGQVIKNAIEPIEDHKKTTDGPIRLIYHTTPHRGLGILVPVFEQLAANLDVDIHLDVYSSFSLYGWPDRDKEYEKLIGRCKEHPQITYHGAVSNDEIRKALKESHIFAYPSIWFETSCISVLEAMSAQVLVICPTLGALPETTNGLAMMYPYSEDINEHANRFGATLASTILNFDKARNTLPLIKNRIDESYSWERRKLQWETFLQGVLKEQERARA